MPAAFKVRTGPFSAGPGWISNTWMLPGGARLRTYASLPSGEIRLRGPLVVLLGQRLGLIDALERDVDDQDILHLRRRCVATDAGCDDDVLAIGADGEGRRVERIALSAADGELPRNLRGLG